MKLLETINNTALAVVALPESIREARAILVEQREEADDLSRSGQLRMRIHELESQLTSANRAGDTAREQLEFMYKRAAELESELATMRAKAEPSIPEPSVLSPDWVLSHLAGLKFPGVGEAYDYMGDCIAGAPSHINKPVSSIPEPDPGEGFELCGGDSASGFKWVLPSGTLNDEWIDISECRFKPNHCYVFRRPIAKPAPQWVACTAAEARTNPGASEWLDLDGNWVQCDNGDFLGKHTPHRTTVALRDDVRVSKSVWDALPNGCRHFSALPKTGEFEWFAVRSTVPVGTVLG